MAIPIHSPRELHYVPLSAVIDDTTFRLRPPGDVSSLAQSLAQCGQLFAIELRPAGDGRWQPLTGFRRLEALRLLHRDRVLARLHGELADTQAAMIAAADAIDTRPLDEEELLETRERYRAMGWSSPALEELFARALEKAAERLEDLAAKLRGDAAPDRPISDEDSAPEPSDGAWVPGGAVDVASSRVGLDPPAPPPLGSPRGSIVAGPPDAPAPIDEGTALEPGTVAVLSDAMRELTAAREGVDDLIQELEDAAESMNRHVPPALATRDTTPLPAAAVPEGAGILDAVAAAAASAPPNHATAGAAPAHETLVAGEALTLDELAEDLAYRLSSISLDLGSLADGWGDVPPHLRAIITDQLQYYSQLGAYLARASGEPR